MFAVPEVDDDTNASASINITKSKAQPGVIKESLPSSPLPSESSVENVEKNSTKMSNPPPPPPPPPPQPSVSAKQHRSRRSLFHRNTIHVCDQIVDRM